MAQSTSVLTQLTNYIQRIPPPYRMIAGGLAALSLPVSYIVYRHMGFESTRESKLRMLAHHATFLTTLVGGILLMHKSIFQLASKTPPYGKVALGLLGAGLIPALGFEGGFYVGKWLFPKKELQPTAPPLAVTAKPATSPLALKAPEGVSPEAFKQIQHPIRPIDPYHPEKSYPNLNIAPAQYLTPRDIAQSRPIPQYYSDMNPNTFYASSHFQPISLGIQAQQDWKYSKPKTASAISSQYNGPMYGVYK